MLELTQSPPEGIKVFLNEDDVTDIQAIIEGPGTLALYYWLKPMRPLPLFNSAPTRLLKQHCVATCSLGCSECVVDEEMGGYRMGGYRRIGLAGDGTIVVVGLRLKLRGSCEMVRGNFGRRVWNVSRLSSAPVLSHCSA